MDKSIRQMTALFYTSISQIHIQKFVIDHLSHIERSTVHNDNRLSTEVNLISIEAMQIRDIFNRNLEVDSHSLAVIISSDHKTCVRVFSD